MQPAHISSANIDVEKIQRAIAANGAQLGISPDFENIRPQFNIHTFTTLPSTSTHLWTLLKAGAKAGTVVVAQQQSAGRGQRSRQWRSAPGGLYLSLALEPDWPANRGPLLTCLSAWGIATAFNNLGIPIGIKWPNDLFYRGKKLGGILTETKLSYSLANGVETSLSPNSGRSSNPGSPGSPGEPTARIKQAVIGVGINWHNTPPNNGISLARILGVEKTSGKAGKNKINCLEMLIALVLRGILQGYFFQQQVGSQDFMKDYQKLLTQVGRSVSLDTNGLLSLAVPVQCQPHPLHETETTAVKALDVATGQAATELSKKQAKEQAKEQAKKQARQWANHSGKVIGVSEEGYLQVALREPSHSSDHHTSGHTSRSANNVLLFKPSEIHI